MSDTRNDSGKESCGECPIATNRRKFLRDTAIVVAASLAAGGLRPRTALASLVSAVRPLKSTGALRTYAMPAGDAVLVDEGNDVIIVRSRGKAYAFSIKCPHKGARLVWHQNEDRIFCPKHKARFTAEGAHVSGRGSHGLNRFSLKQQGREIVVDTSMLFREQDDPGGWSAAVITLA